MSTRLLAVGLLFFACALGPSSGCARHVDLTPNELQRLQGLDPELQALRVHVGTKVWVTYPEIAKADSIRVTRERVTIRNDSESRDKEYTRRVTGQIIGIATLNSMPLLWVTFEPECRDPSCAFGFVLTEYDRYSLVILPKIEMREDPIAYRRTRPPRNNKKEHRNRLRLQRQRSLAEINPVLAVSRRGGRRVLSIDLQFPKQTRKRSRRRRERAKGV